MCFIGKYLCMSNLSFSGSAPFSPNHSLFTFVNRTLVIDVIVEWDDER